MVTPVLTQHLLAFAAAFFAVKEHVCGMITSVENQSAQNAYSLQNVTSKLHQPCTVFPDCPKGPGRATPWGGWEGWLEKGGGGGRGRGGRASASISLQAALLWFVMQAVFSDSAMF